MTATALNVLRLAGDGASGTAISQRLGLSKSRVSRQITRLLALGLIAVDPSRTELHRHSLGLGRVVTYQLTRSGVETLERNMGGSNFQPGGGNTPSVPTEAQVEVHNMEVKVALLAGRIKHLPHEARLREGVWRRWDRDFHGVYLEEIAGKTLLLRAGAVAPPGIVGGREVAERLCRRKLATALRVLDQEYGLLLGEPELRLEYRPGRAKIGVVHHEARPVLPDFQVGELATVDGTPDRRTVHVTADPNDADRLVLMARNLERSVALGEAQGLLLERLIESQSRFLEVASQVLERQGALLQNRETALQGRGVTPDERRDVA